MAIDTYYEEYWQRDETNAYDDPLSPMREAMLWRHLDGRTGRFVEVGCGEGHIVAQAAQRGWDAIGSDISQAAIATARERYPTAQFRVQSLDSDPWPDDMLDADVVASFEVIEHVFAPRRLVQGAYDALRPGGTLILSTPYHGKVKNMVLAVRGWDKHFDVEGQHIRFFTDRALEALLSDVGFSDIRFAHLGRARYLWKNVVVWARRPK